MPDTPSPNLAPSPSLARQLLLTLGRGALYALGLVALLAVTFLLLRVPPASGLGAIWEGAFGTSESGHWYALSETLVKTTPLLLTGLGVVVAWRAGLFSIGGEGQLTIAIVVATAIAKYSAPLPPALQTGLMFVGGVGAGALWGGIAGWLRVKRNVQEVISTIMLNYIALYMLQWVVVGPLQDRAHKIPQSDPIPDAALLPRLLPSSLSDGIQTRLHSGFFLALLAALAVYLFLFLTPQGFALRLLGQNPDAAKTARVPVDKLRIRAMLLSGGLCGLAGVVELLGITGRLYPNFSPGWGYTAIPVALLGGLHPIGTFFSALFFGALNAGTGNLSRYWGVSSALIYVIQGVAVLAIVGGRAWKNRQIGSETD